MKKSGKVSNVDKLWAEHPFLERIVRRAEIWEVEVRRPAALAELDGYATLAFWDVWYEHRFLLLDAFGNIVGRVGEGRWFKSWTRDEKCSKALKRLGPAASRVRYAVFISGYSHGQMVFFKLPQMEEMLRAENAGDPSSAQAGEARMEQWQFAYRLYGLYGWFAFVSWVCLVIALLVALVSEGGQKACVTGGLLAACGFFICAVILHAMRGSLKTKWDLTSPI